jgi:hypothetical protein
VVFTGSDWRYAEFADGGFVPHIGAPRSPAEAASAAAGNVSAPEGAASAPR